MFHFLCERWHPKKCNMLTPGVKSQLEEKMERHCIKLCEGRVILYCVVHNGLWWESVPV